jgi:chromate transport protein ChrA
MKTATLAGVVVVLLVLALLVAAHAGYKTLDLLRGVELIASLLVLDAAQDAAERGDEVLAEAASFIAVIIAVLPLL